MANTTLTISTIIPLGLCLDWPYAYLCGTNTASKILRIEKYDVSSWPWVLKDSATHYTSSIGAAYYGCKVGTGSYTGYLYLCGYYNDGNNHAIVRKVDKTNLSTITWTWDRNNFSTACNMISCMMDTDGSIYAGGNGDNGSPAYGTAVKLNSAGAQQWYAWGIYSNNYGPIAFYGTTYIDMMGSYGGYRNIWRFTKSSGAYYQACGNPGSIGYYQFYNGVPNIESGTTYYYLAGNYEASLGYPIESLVKIQQANPGLAPVWEKTYDKWVSPNATYEDCRGVCTDGTYFYAQAFYYANGGSTNPTPTFFCYNTAGTARWTVPILGPSNKLMFVNSIQQVTGQDYFFDVLYDYTSATGSNGYLEMRNKSDGSLADSSSYYQPRHGFVNFQEPGIA